MFIWVLFAEGCCGRYFSAALHQLSLRLGELRVFNWLKTILFSWICKNFQKHLDGDLCIFLMVYISDLFWRTYIHKGKQETKKMKAGRWDYGSTNLHIVLFYWCDACCRLKKLCWFYLLLRADYSQAIKEYWWSSSLTQVFV